jgi:hypothetical protein
LSSCWVAQWAGWSAVPPRWVAWRVGWLAVPPRWFSRRAGWSTAPHRLVSQRTYCSTGRLVRRAGRLGGPSPRGLLDIYAELFGRWAGWFVCHLWEAFEPSLGTLFSGTQHMASFIIHLVDFRTIEGWNTGKPLIKSYNACKIQKVSC